MKEDLDELIKLWRPVVPEPLAFKREVWSRIEQRGNTDKWFERFFEWFARPKIASVAAAVALLSGALIGAATAGQSRQAAYLHAVNPYAQIVLK
jgi:hypothetical protein